MDSKITKQFYGYIDKARIMVPEMKNPSVLLLYEDNDNEKEIAEAFAFAYCDDKSFMQLIGNFLVQNPQLIESTQHALDGAVYILDQQKSGLNNDK